VWPSTTAYYYKGLIKLTCLEY